MKVFETLFDSTVRVQEQGQVVLSRTYRGLSVGNLFFDCVHTWLVVSSSHTLPGRRTLPDCEMVHGEREQ